MYGLRLISAIEERTYDEIVDLILWLPKGSGLHASISAGSLDLAKKLHGWTPAEDLLLGLANLINHQTYVLQQVNSPKRITPPKPIDGPLGKTPDPTTDVNAVAQRLLAEQKG